MTDDKPDGPLSGLFYEYDQRLAAAPVARGEA